MTFARSLRVAAVAALLAVASHRARAAVPPGALLGDWDSSWVYLLKAKENGVPQTSVGAEEFQFSCAPGGVSTFAGHAAHWSLLGSAFQVDWSSAVKQDLFAEGYFKVKAITKATSIHVVNPFTPDAGAYGKITLKVSVKKPGEKVKLKAKGDFMTAPGRLVTAALMPKSTFCPWRFSSSVL